MLAYNCTICIFKKHPLKINAKFGEFKLFLYVILDYVNRVIYARFKFKNAILKNSHKNQKA